MGLVNPSAASPWNVEVKAADETVNNSATLQDDDDLKFAVVANGVYYYRLIITVTSGSTPDIKLGWTLPAGAAMNRNRGNGNMDDPTEASTYAPACYADKRLTEEFGVIVVGATAGTAQFQWAQNTANVSDTKVHAGSCLWWAKAN